MNSRVLWRAAAVLAGVGLLAWSCLGLMLPPGAALSGDANAHRAYLHWYHGITLHALGGLLGLLLIAGVASLALADFISNWRRR